MVCQYAKMTFENVIECFLFCLRFGVLHPTRVNGLVLINGSAASGSQSFFEKLVGLKASN